MNAFVDLIKEYGQEEYDFSLRETQTYEIIEDVARLRSEIIAVPLADESDMRVGYITHRKGIISRLGNSYLEALMKYTTGDIYGIEEKARKHMQTIE